MQPPAVARWSLVPGALSFAMRLGGAPAPPPYDPCAVLTPIVASTVLHGQVLLVDRGRCDWERADDPRTYIEFATTETGNLAVEPANARRQIVKNVGDSAVWFPLAGQFHLDAYAKNSKIQVWIYTRDSGMNPANDLTGCRIVARDIVKHIDVGR